MHPMLLSALVVLVASILHSSQYVIRSVPRDLGRILLVSRHVLVCAKNQRIQRVSGAVTSEWLPILPAEMFGEQKKERHGQP